MSVRVFTINCLNKNDLLTICVLLNVNFPLYLRSKPTLSFFNRAFFGTSEARMHSPIVLRPGDLTSNRSLPSNALLVVEEDDESPFLSEGGTRASSFAG